MVEKLKIGEKIVIEIRLENREEDRFLKVSLVDEFGNVLPQSPVFPSHQLLGTYVYEDSNLVFPGGVTHIKAIIDVYLDNGFTSLDPNYFGSLSIFSLDTTDGSSSSQREIIGIIKASVETQEVDAVLTSEQTEGQLDDTQKLTATVKDEGVVVGEPKSDTVTGTIQKDN